MRAAPTIAILLHEFTTHGEAQQCRAVRCAEHWTSWGMRVRILHGIREPPQADLLIPQVNLSVMPPDYRDYIEAHPRVVNRGLYDNRRRTFSRNLVARDDAYDGPVVVKTNANYGGLPEHRLMLRSPWSKRWPYRCKQITLRLAQQCSRGPARLAYVDFMAPRDYQVFASKRELPDSVFRNEALVVERFRAECHDGIYWSRNYSFFGAGNITVLETSEEPLIRGGKQCVVDLLPRDDGILAVAKSLGLEYGKLDYALVDGEIVLFDVNLTPSSNFNVFPEIKWKVIEAMSQGIFDWFPEMRPTGNAECGVRSEE